MKNLILILLLNLIIPIVAQHKYPDLKYITIDKSYLNGEFGYPNSAKFKLVNRFCSDSKECYDYGDPITLIGNWNLSNGKYIEFYYKEAPSNDPTFIAVYNNEIILEEFGSTFHLKGKIAYIEGSANSYFDKKRKFKFDNEKYKEVKQPFYYINSEGRLNFPISIYETEEFINKVAQLPKGYKITILLGITGGEYNELQKILIKSEFGLIGWFDFKKLGYNNEPLIPYFYFNGD